MRLERQRELLDRLAAAEGEGPWFYAPASMRNPASAYTDAQRFERERQILFRERPQFVGLTADCAQPGAWLTADLGGIPIVVLRQADGSLRAMVNACRHRGARLLEGSGAGGLRRIVCPYHGWTFETDGRLAHRPAVGCGFDDIAGDCDLHARAVAEKYGMIFVHPGAATPFEVDSVLCGAERELADFGLESYVHIETRSNSWKMNWKLVLDTFTESYHIRFLHRNSIAPLFLNDVLFDPFGPHPRTIGLRKTIIEELRSKPRDQWQLLPFATTQYILVPNGLVTYQLDHIEVWRVTPIDVDTVQVATGIYAAEAPRDDKARRYWTRNLDILLQVTETEDFPQMELIQKNLASGALPELIYGRLEPALIHMHASINAALAAGSGPAMA